MTKSQDVINKIKQEKIKPIPRWVWLAREIIYWAILVFLIVFGSLVFSFLILNLLDFHFGLRNIIIAPPIGKYLWLFVRMMPVIWFLLAILIVFLSVMIFGRTKHGYRHQSLLIVSAIVLAVSLFAFGAHFLNFSRKIENAFEGAIPRNFHKFMPPKEGRFFLPEEGIVVGRIIEVENEYFFIINFQNERWKIMFPEKKDLTRSIQIEKGLRVFVVGEKIGENIFQAKDIRLFEKERKGERRYGQQFNQMTR